MQVGALAVFFCSIVLAGFLIKWGRLALHLPLSVSAMVEAGEEAEAAVVAAERALMLDVVATDGFMAEAGQSLLTERWPNVMQHLILGATGVGIGVLSLLALLVQKYRCWPNIMQHLILGATGVGIGVLSLLALLVQKYKCWPNIMQHLILGATGVGIGVCICIYKYIHICTHTRTPHTRSHRRRHRCVYMYI
jgi:nitroreductase